MYQVKFSRCGPLAIINPHEWVKDIVDEEIPKVRELIPKGAKEYYLLTNVPGTAFPEAGSIDIVQKLLKEHLGSLGNYRRAVLVGATTLIVAARRRMGH